MTAKIITQLTALAAADAASADVLPIVDVSDTTMAATGTTKKITLTDLQSAPVSAGTANGVLYLNGSKVATSGSALTFDGANLGLGVTPSAWSGNSVKAIQMSTAGAVWALDAGTGNKQSLLSSNVYNIGGTSYRITADGAAMYSIISSGQHAWHTAPSGTAGTPISFTQAMTLDANGKLGLGVTPTTPLDIAIPAGAGTPRARVDQLADNPYYELQRWSGGGANYFSTRIRNVGGAIAFEQSNSAPIGSQTFTQAMTLNTSGDLLVGCTSIVPGQQGVFFSPDAGNRYLLSTSTSLSYQLQFVNANGAVGSVTTTGTATAYNTSSDYRLKDNQTPLTGSGAFIDALKPKTWNWKADGTKGVGFIAHEVQEVSPTSVVGEKDATRIEQYEISPAVPATYDEEGNELTPAVEAVMGEREVPAYQAMEYGSAEFIANIVAELQSLRKRVAALEAK